MSLLHVIDEAIKMCKAEESRLSESIRQYKELLRSMRTRVTDTSEPEPSASIDVPPEEKQEIELLDQVLKKALRIRSTSEAHKELSSDHDIKKKRPNKNSNKSPIHDAAEEEDKSKLVKSVSSKSCRKLNHRVQSAGGSVTREAMLTQKGSSSHSAVRGKQSVSKSCPVKIYSTGSQHKICVKTTSDKGSSQVHSTSNSCQTLSKEDEKSTPGTSLPNELWRPSPLLPVWRSQRAKQSRLWNKVLTRQSKPVPERTRFTERLQSTFPYQLPSGCPADIRTKLEVLTQRCLDLTHCFHAELQTQRANQSGPAGSEPGASGERQYESSLMLDSLERMTEELLTCADQQMKDWERWNKCRSEVLCPVRKRGDWGDPDCSGLPPILSYTSETQLRRLESQRLQVEQLQQAVKLQQAMSDNLASCWTVMDSDPERLSAGLLRGLYSLLAEGGLQFPSLVLDSE